MTRYLTAFAGFLVVASVILFIINTGATEIEITIRWAIFGYFSFITFVSHFGLVTATKGRTQTFIRYYIGATTLKLIIHLAVMILFSLFYRQYAVRFIFTFFINYIVFTVFEVAFIFWGSRKQG
jgi:hypothetical protein